MCSAVATGSTAYEYLLLFFVALIKASTKGTIQSATHVKLNNCKGAAYPLTTYEARRVCGHALPTQVSRPIKYIALFGHPIMSDGDATVRLCNYCTKTVMNARMLTAKPSSTIAQRACFARLCAQRHARNPVCAARRLCPPGPCRAPTCTLKRAVACNGSQQT